MTSHDFCRDHLGEYLDQSLDPNGRGEVEAHLESCAECAQIAHEMSSIRSAMREMKPMPAPANLRRNVRVALQEEQARKGRKTLAPITFFTRRLPQLAWSGSLAMGAIALILLARPFSNAPLMVPEAGPQSGAAAPAPAGAPGTSPRGAETDSPSSEAKRGASGANLGNAASKPPAPRQRPSNIPQKPAGAAPPAQAVPSPVRSGAATSSKSAPSQSVPASPSAADRAAPMEARPQQPGDRAQLQRARSTAPDAASQSQPDAPALQPAPSIPTRTSRADAPSQQAQKPAPVAKVPLPSPQFSSREAPVFARRERESSRDFAPPSARTQNPTDEARRSQTSNSGAESSGAGSFGAASPGAPSLKRSAPSGALSQARSAPSGAADAPLLSLQLRAVPAPRVAPSISAAPPASMNATPRSAAPATPPSRPRAALPRLDAPGNRGAGETPPVNAWAGGRGGHLVPLPGASPDPRPAEATRAAPDAATFSAPPPASVQRFSLQIQTARPLRNVQIRLEVASPGRLIWPVSGPVWRGDLTPDTPVPVAFSLRGARGGEKITLIMEQKTAGGGSRILETQTLAVPASP